VPIHAAGIYDGMNQECCADYVVSSYTPTLAALLRAQQGQRAFTREQIQIVTIAVEHAKDPNMSPLRYVAQEAQDITRIVAKAGASSFDAATSSKSDVMAMLESANAVHFACHGVQHESEPHKSRFCLSTDDLTVSELMRTDLDHAFLAFLSACETAKGAEKHADEVVHLAATMLFAGFESVVATMWYALYQLF
jgi:CHAT domain-containing protein